MYDVAVIGGGVVGGLIARELSRCKLSVCILEREYDVAMGATKANSAIVHAGFDAEMGSLKALLNVKGSEMMKQVTDELGVKYKRNGSLVIGFNEEDVKTLFALLERGKKNGVKGLEIIDGDRLFALEPKLSRNVKAALYAPTGAIVCPYELCIAAVGNAMDNGAELFCDFEVSDIKNSDDHYTVTSSDCKAIEAKYIINAAGIYSDRIAELAGVGNFTVTPRKGEYILLDRSAGNIVSHTVFRTPSKMGKGILVTPTVDGNLLIGPTSVNIEDKENKATTNEGISNIIREANENIDGGIPVGKTITSFTGLRSVGSTGDFIINSVGRFVNAAGIESPGLSASPAIAEYVASLLEKSGLMLEKKDDFNPFRKPKHYFRDADIETKNEMIRKNPSYGKTVCRCEGITEGEIIDAIRSNPPARTVDGVKHRTRSGMGRCQGGFCGAAVIELIAKENGISYEEVTKSGKGSNIVFGKTK